MGRSGYDEDGDCESNFYALWPSIIQRSINGKRGQAFFKALRGALEALPEKQLVEDDLQRPDGAVCALGALGKMQGVALDKLEPTDVDAMAKTFGIAPTLVREVTHTNDDDFHQHGRRVPLYWVPKATEYYYIDSHSHGGIWPRTYVPETPTERYQRVLDWVISNIKEDTRENA